MLINILKYGGIIINKVTRFAAVLHEFSIDIDRYIYIYIYIKLNSVVLVRTRTIPTEQPPPVGEVSANFCG